MRIYKDYDFYDLMNVCWSGAIDTLNTIQKHDKKEELMSLLSLDCFSEMPDLTEVNDLLWFEDEWIFEQLGIDDEEDDDEEDDDYEEEDDDYDNIIDEDDEWDSPEMDVKYDGDRYDFPERF